MIKITPALLYFGVSIGAGTCLIHWKNTGPLYQALLAFIFLDYITGMAAAYAEGKLSSKEGFKGIVTKVMVLAIVAGAHVISVILHMPFMAEAVIFFYLANELLSLIENAGRLNVPVPKVLLNAVEMLKNKKTDLNKHSKS